MKYTDINIAETNTAVVIDNGVKNRTQVEDIISHDQMIFIMRVLMYGVTPAVCIFGIVGNVFSIIILYKHGLHKCSNILLISLAVADLTFLVAFNNVPKILYKVVGIADGYGYNRETSLALFILFLALRVLDYAPSYISLNMPMFITFERLVAVYLPFQFNIIITPARTWCAVVLLYIFWFTFVVYMSFWWTFSYTFDPIYNISVGRMSLSSSFHDNNPDSVETCREIADYMLLKIPPLVTLIGCILISVKVKMAATRRKKMTQTTFKDSSSNRTTKTLLAVCGVYLAMCVALNPPFYIPQVFNIFGDDENNLSPVLFHAMNIIMCINSSANFIVYVAINKKFQNIFKSLFTFADD